MVIIQYFLPTYNHFFMIFIDFFEFLPTKKHLNKKMQPLFDCIIFLPLYPKLTRAYTVRTGLFECPAVLLFAPCTPGTRRSSALRGTQAATV